MTPIYKMSTSGPYMHEIMDIQTQKIVAFRKLRALRQRGSASFYAVRFRNIASVLGWGDEQLMSFFYDGLKEDVKDVLYIKDMPGTFEEYIAMAVDIDNKQHIRRLERKATRSRNR